MELPEAFRWYGDWAEESADSPLYARLSRGVADEARLLDLVSDRLEGQPAPQLLLGAVHDRLLSGVSHRLADWYPTCVESPRDPTEEDPFPAFRAFCTEYEAEIRDLVTTRRVATNAVGRSAVLFPAFARVGDEDGGPLSLLEIGASAGLNLRWDSYHYLFDGRSYGRSDSPVTIESAVRSGHPPLLKRPPAIENRLGVDLHPPDLADPTDRRWLRALVVPEHADRHQRLVAAIDAVGDDPPIVEAGDATSCLPELLERFDAAGPVCVFSTHVRYQMDESETEAIDEALREWSTRRGRVHSLHTDNEAECPGNGYRHVVFEDGGRVSDELVGAYESYGRWIEWYVDG